MFKINRFNYQEKIVALWTVFLLGTVFHTQLDLMPLFLGIDVAIVRHHQEIATMAEIKLILWRMLLFFSLPMIVIVSTVFVCFISA